MTTDTPLTPELLADIERMAREAVATAYAMRFYDLVPVPSTTTMTVSPESMARQDAAWQADKDSALDRLCDFQYARGAWEERSATRCVRLLPEWCLQCRRLIEAEATLQATIRAIEGNKR